MTQMIARTFCGVGVAQWRALRTAPLWPRGRRLRVTRGISRASTKKEAMEMAEEVPEVEVLVRGEVQKRSFLRKAEVKEYVGVDEEKQTVGTFDEMGLEQGLIARLKAAGFKSPTPVQSMAIPSILDGEDCALQSYTGSGKTLAYLLPILTNALRRAQEEQEDQSIPIQEKGQLQALIVAPSQELAMQIVRVAKMLLPNDAARMVQQLIGGANINRQVEALKTKPLIAVGTPGRLAELSRKGSLLSHKCPVLVLDEVDQLSKFQFRQDMLRLTSHAGKKLERFQTVIVSATLTPAVIDRIGKWMPDARFVFIGTQAAMNIKSEDPATAASTPQTTTVPRWGWGNKWSTTEDLTVKEPSVKHGSISMPPSIRHGYVLVDPRMKVDSLRRAIHAMEVQKCLVFMNFARRTKDALFKLSARGMAVGALHGDKSKLERSKILQQFRNGELRALVVSDVAARGLDVLDCDAVFNLELPSDASHYAHRAGRTGRMGRVGWVLSFVEKHEMFVIEKLASRLKIEIPQVDIRNGEVRLREKVGMPKE